MARVYRIFNYQLVILLVFTHTFISCSSTVEFPNMVSGAPSNQTMVRSNALHHYLKGRLLVNRGAYKDALSYFTVVVDELGQSVPDSFLFENAGLRTHNGDLEGAIKTLELLKKRHGTLDDSVSILLAGLLESTGRYEDSRREYLRLVESGAKNIEPYLFVSYSLWKQEEYKEAKAILTRYSGSEGHQAMIFRTLGEYQESLKEFDKALRSYKAAMSLKDEGNNAAISAGRVLLKQGKRKEAEVHFEGLLQKQPSDYILRNMYLLSKSNEVSQEELQKMLERVKVVEHTRLNYRVDVATHLIAEGELIRALEELHLAIAVKPSYSEVRYKLATLYAMMKRPGEAVQQLLRVGRKSPTYAKSRVLAAVVLRQLHRSQEAEEAIREALAVEGNNLQILLILVSILQETQRYEEAQKVLKVALESQPESEKLLYDYGMLLHVMGKQENSWGVMEKVLELNPENTDALNYLAYSMAEKRQDLPRALMLAERVHRLAPDNGYYLDTLGYIYLVQGQYKKALPLLQEAATKVPDDAVILEHYAEALTKAGRNQEAQKFFMLSLAAYEAERDNGILDDHEALERIRAKLKQL